MTPKTRTALSIVVWVAVGAIVSAGFYFFPAGPGPIQNRTDCGSIDSMWFGTSLRWYAMVNGTGYEVGTTRGTQADLLFGELDYAYRHGQSVCVTVFHKYDNVWAIVDVN